MATASNLITVLFEELSRREDFFPWAINVLDPG